MTDETPRQPTTAELGETHSRVQSWLAIYLQNHPEAGTEEFHHLANSFQAAPLYLHDIITLLAVLQNSVGEEGTRYIVVEVPPEASDHDADEITEAVMGLVYHANEHAGYNFDIFGYRQHTTSPFEVKPSD